MAELILSPSTTLLLARAVGFNGTFRDESNYANTILHGTGITGNANAPLPVVYDGRGFYASPGSSVSYLKTDSSPLWTSPDLQLIAELAMPNWQSLSGSYVAKDAGTTGNRSFNWSGGFPANLPGISWFEGGVLRAATGQVPYPFRAWERGWIKVLIDVDDGNGSHAVSFFASRDRTHWSRLGDPVKANGFTGVTSIDRNSALFTAGARTGGGGWLGNIFRVLMLNGLADNASVIYDIDPTLETIAEGATTFDELGPGAQPVTVQNGSNGLFGFLARSSGQVFGASKYLQIPFEDTLCGNLPSLTALVLVSFLGSNAQQVLMSTRSDNVNSAGVYLSKGASGLTPAGSIGDGSAGKIATAAGAVTPLTEVLIALVRDGGFVTLYVDGVAGTPTAESLGSIASLNDLWIGRLPNGTNYGDFFLKGFAVLPTALTAYQQKRAKRELKRREYVHVGGFRQEAFRASAWALGAIPSTALAVDAITANVLAEDAVAEIDAALTAAHGDGTWGIPVPADPNLCNVGGLAPGFGWRVTATLQTPPQFDGGLLLEATVKETETGSDGRWFLSLTQGEQYLVEIPRGGYRKVITVPAATTADLKDL